MRHRELQPHGGARQWRLLQGMSRRGGGPRRRRRYVPVSGLGYMLRTCFVFSQLLASDRAPTVPCLSLAGSNGEQSRWQCPHCGVFASTRSNMLRHLKEKHPASPAKVKEHCCTLCNYKSTRFQHLAVHMTVSRTFSVTRA